MKLITNNPRFLKEDFKNIEVEYHEVEYLDILKKLETTFMKIGKL